MRNLSHLALLMVCGCPVRESTPAIAAPVAQSQARRTTAEGVSLTESNGFIDVENKSSQRLVELLVFCDLLSPDGSISRLMPLFYIVSASHGGRITTRIGEVAPHSHARAQIIETWGGTPQTFVIKQAVFAADGEAAQSAIDRFNEEGMKRSAAGEGNDDSDDGGELIRFQRILNGTDKE